MYVELNRIERIVMTKGCLGFPTYYVITDNHQMYQLKAGKRYDIGSDTWITCPEWFDIDVTDDVAIPVIRPFASQDVSKIYIEKEHWGKPYSNLKVFSQLKGLMTEKDIMKFVEHCDKKYAEY